METWGLSECVRQGLIFFTWLVAQGLAVHPLHEMRLTYAEVCVKLCDCLTSNFQTHHRNPVQRSCRAIFSFSDLKVLLSRQKLWDC